MAPSRAKDGAISPRLANRYSRFALSHRSCDDDVLRGKGFLSVGHDEYWSQEMKANVVQARDQGVGLGFFGGNYMYWPVEFYPDSNGSPNRTISLTPLANRCSVTQTQQCGSDADCSTGETCQIKVCYYSCFVDKDKISSQTEQAIVGGMDQPGIVLPSIVWGGDMFVSNDALIDHWVFANTGLNYGDVIPGLIGIEYNSTIRPEDFWNTVPPPPVYPIPTGLQTLLHTQAPNFGNTPSGGGFPLGDTFDGKDFNGWYDSLKAFAAMNGGNFDLDQKYCAAPKTSTQCTVDADCSTDPANPISCQFPCHTDPIPPLKRPLPDGFCSNPFPYYPGEREDWAMTIYQASSGAWVFNAATNEWTWGLDDYFTGLKTADGADNGPALRTQCGYPFFHPGLVSCRNPALEQITRNVLNKFIGRALTTLSYTGDVKLKDGGKANLSGVLLAGVLPVSGRQVRFVLGSSSSAQTCIGTTDANGLAACTINPVAQPRGPGLVSDAFAGDALYLPASASATTSVTGFPDVVRLSASPSPSTAGQAVRLNAVVVAGPGLPKPPLPSTPTGTVTFYDLLTPLGTVTLDGTATAILNVTFTSPGQHSITAKYSGDTIFLPSSATVKQTVN